MTPSSGIVALNNSQGASAAALELGRILDCAFREGRIFGDVDEEVEEGTEDSEGNASFYKYLVIRFSTQE